MQFRLRQVPTIVVSSPEIAREILKTHVTMFAYRPALLVPEILINDANDIAFAPYGSHRRQLRMVCTTELLSANRLQSFKSIREEEISDFINSINSDKGKLVNLSEKLISLTNGIIARAAFGRKTQTRSAFIELIADLLRLASGFCLADLYPSVKVLYFLSSIRLKTEKFHREANTIVGNILNEHRERKAARNFRDGDAEEGIVDVLLRLQENGEIHQADITSEQSSWLVIFLKCFSVQCTSFKFPVKDYRPDITFLSGDFQYRMWKFINNSGVGNVRNDEKPDGDEGSTSGGKRNFPRKKKGGRKRTLGTVRSMDVRISKGKREAIRIFRTEMYESQAVEGKRDTKATNFHSHADIAEFKFGYIRM